MNTNTINLTDRAADHIRDYLSRNTGIGLRLGVKPTGCSGFQYVIEPVEKISDHDQVFESRGIKVITDNESLKYLAGTELDYVKDGLNFGFRFNNPNVEDTCGCGESFSIKGTGEQTET